ncbi:MAG: peptide deformylase [Candidatus Omnitrophota bacterium]|nr:peptide deformylase [Candidatus Omnitrophota bacterium]
METIKSLKIRLFGDPVLRKKAVSVRKITDYHRSLLDEMLKLMRSGSGIGLAVPQAGINLAMIVVDIGSGLYKLINPKIIKRQGRQVFEEGCLSVPGICIKVKRAKKVSVKALNENAEPVIIEACDLLACVFQHEIDHLKGRLIVDYASFFDKLKIRKKLEELKKLSNKEPPPAVCKLNL